MPATQLITRVSRRIQRHLQQKRIKDYLANNAVRKLQLGSGVNPLPGWLNTDIEMSGDIVFLDIRQPFPLESASFDFVFSEHLIEHVSYQHGVHCLRECFRVLRPGGKIRIATPNLSFLMALYREETTDCERRYIDWSVEMFGGPVQAPPATYVINNFFRNWGHQFIYDFEALRGAMAQSGFVDVRRMKVHESDEPVFCKLEAHGRVIPPEFNELETMVAEARKSP